MRTIQGGSSQNAILPLYSLRFRNKQKSSCNILRLKLNLEPLTLELLKLGYPILKLFDHSTSESVVVSQLHGLISHLFSVRVFSEDRLGLTTAFFHVSFRFVCEVHLLLHGRPNFSHRPASLSDSALAGRYLCSFLSVIPSSNEHLLT